uniref:Uncharacterized protein n=1 Tax=Timema bartmani TaxID=61472 RepID=A0A7R9EWE5_9NEOP|nr:unnamed protein product [Timema bartmani]
MEGKLKEEIKEHVFVKQELQMKSYPPVDLNDNIKNETPNQQISNIKIQSLLDAFLPIKQKYKVEPVSSEVKDETMNSESWFYKSWPGVVESPSDDFTSETIVFKDELVCTTVQLEAQLFNEQAFHEQIKQDITFIEQTFPTSPKKSCVPPKNENTTETLDFNENPDFNNILQEPYNCDCYQMMLQKRNG